ncbi:MAG: hypothetical protein EP330_24155 [Deltaproteobacteria bacterium]|nr:MAG: hypothetical protein EP330_24155 [Deltaproteobacteria bacterium]
MRRPLYRLLSLALVSGIAGCEFSDVETADTGDGSPDLRGVYEMVLSDLSGCEGVTDPWPFDGNFTVTGEPDALTFAWPLFTATGATDPSFAVSLAGTGEFGGDTLELEADGVASPDAAEAWVLDLGISAELVPVDTGASGCTLTGTLTATQLSAR